MPAQKGRELLLQVEDGSGGYETVGGFTSNSFNINGAPVDITNKDSAGFKESLNGGSTISISTNGNGVFMDDDGFQRVHDAAISNAHLNARIIVPDFMHYVGPFIVSSLDLTGDTDGAVNYSIQLESAGAIAATAI